MAESDLHIQLKQVGALWLWRKGFDAIATEVEIGPMGSIADVLGYKTREFTTAIVEAKASRGDFLGWKKRRSIYYDIVEKDAPPAATFNYIIAPRGLLKKEEMPHLWGFISVGLTAVCLKKAPPQYINPSFTSYAIRQIARKLTTQIWYDRGSILPRPIRKRWTLMMGRNGLIKPPLRLAGTPERRDERQMKLPSAPLIVQCPYSDCRKMGADETGKEEEREDYKLILVRCQSCKKLYVVKETYSESEVRPGHEECSWSEFPVSSFADFKDEDLP